MEVKLKVKDPTDGKFYACPVELEFVGKRIELAWGWNDLLRLEVKAMQGAKWHGFDKANPKKVWSIENNQRNRFRLASMQWMGRSESGDPKVPGTHDPYEWWDKPIQELTLTDRPYYSHQKDGIQYVWTKRRCELAYDMGVGKTLIILRVMEEAHDKLGWQDDDFLYVCKNGAIFQVEMDFDEWKSRVHPRFVSYETMRAMVDSWPSSVPAPKFIVFDESTQIKSPTAQRSINALKLANMARDQWGEQCFIVNMTGTPAPKNPVDWWHQVEVLCPGFIREGDVNKFTRRLAIIEDTKKEDGGSYPKRIAWLDDEARCKKCGLFAAAVMHSREARLTEKGHPFEKAPNEVANLHKRLKPIVDVRLKRDCLDLPERVHRIIRVKPSQQLLNAAKLIAAKATSAVQAMTLLRELSDGFQYSDAPISKKQCGMCGGSGTMIAKYDPENPWDPVTDEALRLGRLLDRIQDCDECSGSGEVDIVKRGADRTPCAKDEVVEELLDEHKDIGRIVFYAGFQDSVDRVAELCLKNDWQVVKAYGKGWSGLNPKDCKNPLPVGGKKLYEAFRYGLESNPKTAFVAQASTAAHGLNFDVSPTIAYYSNDFHWENRTQGDERNMRGKIKETLKKHGLTKVTLIDIINLPSDELVLKNHAGKRRLQAMTIGDVVTAMRSLDLPHQEVRDAG